VIIMTSNTAINIPVTVANAANAATSDLSNYGPKRTFSFVGPANSIVKIYGSGDGTNFPAITSTPLVAIAANSPPVTIDDLCLKYRAVPTAVGTACTVDCPPQTASGGGGSAFLSTCQVSDKPAGGSIGAPSATVDAYEVAQVDQNTAGQTLTLPNPTDTTASRRFYVEAVGAANFIMGNIVVQSGGGIVEYLWDGTQWNSVAPGTISGVSVLLGAAGGTSTRGAIVLDNGGAQITTVGAGTVDINTDAGGNIQIKTDTTGAVDIDSGTTGAITIGVGASAKIVTVGNITGATAINALAGTGGISMTATGAGGITLTAGATGDINVNMGTGTLNLGTNATVHTVNIGSSTGASAVNVIGGTGGIGVGANAIAQTVTVGNITGASSVVIHSGTGNIDIGVDAVAHTVRIGSVTGAAATLVQSGSGALALESQGTINVGVNAIAQTITIGNSTGATSVVINGGTGGISVGANAIAQTITIGNATGATSVVVNGGTGAMQFGANAIAHAVTIGTTTGAGSLALRAGTGGLTIVNNGVTWTWPTADGGAGTKLTTNGAGVLSFT
jgi:hypothetical protein